MSLVPKPFSWSRLTLLTMLLLFFIDLISAFDSNLECVWNHHMIYQFGRKGNVSMLLEYPLVSILNLTMRSRFPLNKKFIWLAKNSILNVRLGSEYATLYNIYLIVHVNTFERLCFHPHILSEINQMTILKTPNWLLLSLF